MVSVFDVARRAGLSIATVSRALSGSASVKEDTRQRVLAAAEQLGYQPNPFAQSLRQGRGRTVALVTGDIRHGIYAALAKHVQLELESLGLDTMLYDLDHREHRLQHLLERASAMGLRGILLATADAFDVAKLLPQLQSAVEGGIVLASVSQRLDAQGITSIVHDNAEGARAAVEHLHARGRGPIAFLGRISTSGTGRERYEGYLQGLRKIRQRRSKDLVFELFEGYRSDAGYQATSAALDKKIEFGAILAATDDMALGAMSSIRERGLRIPEDVAVIGFGGFEWGKYVVPPLTTLSLDVVSMAAHIRSLFESGGEQAVSPLVTLIPARLDIRQSS
jgi:DNA-binding LacI/PurR family transcriptional regulator